MRFTKKKGVTEGLVHPETVFLMLLAASAGAYSYPSTCQPACAQLLCAIGALTEWADRARCHGRRCLQSLK